MKKLNRTTTGLPAARPVKVLQFGDGNFLRGFAEWVIDILNERTDFNGDVLLVRPLRKGGTATADDQEGLYHIATNGLQHGNVVSETRMITCIAGAIDPYNERQRFLEAARSTDLQFVISNTTEAGIVFDEKETDLTLTPENFPAKITQLLYERFNFFKGDSTKGLIFLPCELIEKNGDTLREMILKYASLWNLDKGFSSWVNDHNVFCNSLVDRIVPGFPKDRIEEIQQTIGYEDRRVVSTEPFSLWVIEENVILQNRFPVGQTSLDVKFVPDLSPYRIRKVRILNGAHTTLVPYAYLKGLRTVKQSMDDTSTRDFIRKAVFHEIIPTIDLPPSELERFAEDVLERFQNPFIKHELKSIALNSIAKFNVRVLPTILEYHKLKGVWPKHLLHSFACLIAYYRGEWKGQATELNDHANVLTFFREVWANPDPDLVVGKVLSNQAFWGQDLSILPGLKDQLVKELSAL